MTDPLFIIPAERLPPGFADKVEQPHQHVADPKPAATVVLLRDHQDEMQVLLLKRHRSAGFVPGAYVFPGGRIDESDADARLVANCEVPARGAVPAHYWFGAVREVFEETGVLLARTNDGEWAPDTTEDEAVETWRLALMNDETSLAQIVVDENLRVVLDDVVYFAHWITPDAEPRRYDTRFFAARLPRDRNIKPDEREMVDAIWITATDALERFQNGELPMVFPTVRTLQDLTEFHSVDAALSALRLKDVEPVQPRLVRAEGGVGIVIDGKDV